MKKPWQSKTILINGIVGLAAFVSMFLPAASGVPSFISAHPSEIAMAWSILNIALRAITKDKVQLSD